METENFNKAEAIDLRSWDRVRYGKPEATYVVLKSNYIRRQDGYREHMRILVAPVEDTAQAEEIHCEIGYVFRVLRPLAFTPIHAADIPKNWTHGWRKDVGGDLVRCRIRRTSPRGQDQTVLDYTTQDGEHGTLHVDPETLYFLCVDNPRQLTPILCN